MADYQFGRGVGVRLFPEGTVVKLSKRTGRPRYVLLEDALLATVRSGDGMLALTVHGGVRLSEAVEWPRFRMAVKGEFVGKVVKFRAVRAGWVSLVDEMLLPNDEVLVYGPNGRLIGVGRASVSGGVISTLAWGTVAKIRDLAEDREPAGEGEPETRDCPGRTRERYIPASTGKCRKSSVPHG